MTASQRIKHLIKVQGTTIEGFAEKVGTTKSALNQMFKNDSNPKLTLLQACMRNFPQLSLKWLVMGEGEMWEGGVWDSKKEAELIALKEQLGKMEKQTNKFEESIEESMKNIHQRLNKLEED